MFPHMHDKKHLKYEELLIVVKHICNKFYNSNKTMFNNNVRTRDDEKDVIYSSCRIKLSKNFSFDEIELQKAVGFIVDEINIKNYSSMLPPKA